MRSPVLFLSFALLTFALLHAQQPAQPAKPGAQSKAPPAIPPTGAEPSPDEVIRVDVDIVNVLCNVRDKRGGLVGNLDKDAFTVFEDGKKQDIKYFTRETNLPLTIGLLVDVSLSQQNLIQVEKNASLEFFSRVLRKEDLAFIISFGADAELLQDYTNSQKLLRSALDGLRVNAGVGGLHPGPVPSQPRGTILFDTVFLAASDQLRSQVGRKAIIVITDGVDMGSRYTRERAIEAAQKTDAIIYGIHYVDYAAYGGFGASDGDLKRMAENTGGRVFHIDRGMPLQEAYRQIEQEMRSQYAIGFVPSNPNKDGAFRKLEIKMANKDLKVQARKGYYATKDIE